MKRFCFLCFVCLLSVAAFSQEKVQLKVMTYNLRFGELASLQELGEFIKQENPDIVMLQEVDVNTRRERAPKQNGKHFIAELGFYTGMFSAYAKSIPYKGGYYGLGLLSKYPFVSTERVLLPMVEKGREQRSLLVGRVELDNGEVVTVASTHLDLKASIRPVQVKYINKVLKKEKNPVLLAGDFNARPDAPEIAEGMKGWKHSMPDDAYTIPAKEPKSKIDYIFSYPEAAWQVVDAEVPVSYLSDHRPVVTVLELNVQLDK